LTDVESLEVDHRRVSAQLGVQLAVAHIDCHYRRCACLQHAVGKSSRRGPGIKGTQSGGIEGEAVERST
jgi:hypothetical protein